MQTPCTFKMPSTPDSEYLPQLLNTPDSDEIKSLHHYLKLQQQQQQQPLLGITTTKLSSLVSNNNSPAENRKLVDLHQISSPAMSRHQHQQPHHHHHHGKKSFITPDSSQTDSDDVSPQIQRKRKTAHARDILPRFSISIEDEFSGYVLVEVCCGTVEFRVSYCYRPETGTSSSENTVPYIGAAANLKHRSRSVVKSASALGLSLMISSGKICSMRSRLRN